MPINVSVKNVPDDVMEKLRDRAKRHHRSLQGELVAILEEATAVHKLTLDELWERVEGRGLHTSDDATETIRRDRDAR